MRIIIVVFMAVFSLSITAQNTPQAPSTSQPATSKWLSYTDASSGIGVKYPATWKLKTTNPKAPIVLHAPAGGGDDSFSENINYITRDLPPAQKVTLDDIAMSVSNGLTNVVDDFKLEYQKKLQWADVKAIEFSYSGISKGANAGLKVKLLQRMALVKGKLLIATYTAEDSETDLHKAVALQILNKTTFK
jgi:hypothetical protein